MHSMLILSFLSTRGLQSKWGFRLCDTPFMLSIKTLLRLLEYPDGLGQGREVEGQMCLRGRQPSGGGSLFPPIAGQLFQVAVSKPSVQDNNFSMYPQYMCSFVDI